MTMNEVTHLIESSVVAKGPLLAGFRVIWYELHFISLPLSIQLILSLSTKIFVFMMSAKNRALLDCSRVIMKIVGY